MKLTLSSVNWSHAYGLYIQPDHVSNFQWLRLARRNNSPEKCLY